MDNQNEENTSNISSKYDTNISLDDVRYLDEDSNEIINGFFQTTSSDLSLLVPKEKTHKRNISVGNIVIPSQISKAKINTAPRYFIDKKVVHYEREEIQRAVDEVMHGKTLDFSEPCFISEIIEELTSRMIVLISSFEYKKAKLIVDLIKKIRSQFHNIDFDNHHKLTIGMLKNRYNTQKDVLSDLKMEYTQHIAEAKQMMNDRIIELKSRQNQKRDELINKWKDSTQTRHYNKKSNELLNLKAQEKYLVLTGDFEGANQIRKQNKAKEIQEVEKKHHKMIHDFENAREQLEKELVQEYDDFRQNCYNEIEIIDQKYSIDIERETRKLKIITRMMQEHRKHKSSIHYRKAQIPFLARTGDNIVAKNQFKHNGIDEFQTKPLDLPPLIVKKRNHIRPYRSQDIKIQKTFL